MEAGGRGFADDAGPVVPVACHLGDALSRYARDPGGVHALLKQISAAGYHGVRTWTAVTFPFWEGRKIYPGQPADYWNVVSDFVGALRHHSLRWLVSQGDLLTVYSGTVERQRFMRELASRLRLEDVVGVDAGNEAWQTGEADPVRLRDAMNAFREVLAVPVWSLTSPQSEETFDLLRYAGSVADVHTYRGGHWYDKVRHVFNNSFEGVTDRPLIQSEAFGPGSRVSVTENKHEIDTGVMLAGAVAAAMSGQMWVYFSGPGVISDEGEQLGDMPGFAETPALLALLPKDAGTGELVHGGDRFAGRRVFAASPKDDSRTLRWEHAFLSEKRFIALGYAPNFQHVQESYERPERAFTSETVVALGQRALLVVGRTT